MGKSGRSQRRRSDVKFPTRGEAFEAYNSASSPVLKLPRRSAMGYVPKGTRLRKYSLTPEEQLMRYAPEGTAPERLVFGWLVVHQFTFTFQEAVAGGRAIPGGAVVDFVIYDKIPPIALRVMSYWHEPATQQVADAIQAEMLMEYGYRVEDVWEWEINTYEKVSGKMMEILYGTPKFGTTGVVATYKCPYCGDPNCVKCEAR